MRNRNNYTPDVLDCLASLSNDEVFTPPKVVNQMLDLLPQEVFQSRETTFLDPFTKSGVFLREITKRLLEYQVPNYKEIASEIEQITVSAIQKAIIDKQLDKDDKNFEDKAREVGDIAIEKHKNGSKYIAFKKQLQKALDHILTKQVFGIAITELTAELARRSLYCSKDASGKYSIVNGIFNGKANGNIRFVPMKHKWEKGNCIFCGASRKNLDRPDEYESHAYEFIHRNNMEDIFMGLHFTVVCGNPPYQLNDGGGNGSSAVPIYQEFVNKAKCLNPSYLTMIIPARWYSGGKGLDKFRETMLSDKHITHLVDYVNSQDCFSGVSIKGGICYFLWERDLKEEKKCHITTYFGNDILVSDRYLLEEGCDIFIRWTRGIDILNKVRVFKENSFASIVSARRPFGFVSTFSDYKKSDFLNAVKLYAHKQEGYVRRNQITQNQDLVDKYKILISFNYGAGEGFPHQIINKPFIAEPNSCCTETYIVIGSFVDKSVAQNVLSYIKTKFFRFMVLLHKSTQSATAKVYSFVPMQDFSKSWTDAELYAKYNLTQEEIKFIENMVKPME